jgi:hypothetical protein
MRASLLYAVGSCLALGAADAWTAEVTPAGAAIERASDQNSGHVIPNLALLPLPADSDNPTPAAWSATTVNGAGATPVPELPTWTMMLLSLAGLGLAGFKKSRKNRLSPGIE